MLKNAVDKLNWELVHAGDIMRTQARGLPVLSWRVKKTCLYCESNSVTYGIIDYDVFRWFSLRRWLRRKFHMKDYVVWEVRIPSLNKLS